VNPRLLGYATGGDHAGFWDVDGRTRRRFPLYRRSSTIPGTTADDPGEVAMVPRAASVSVNTRTSGAFFKDESMRPPSPGSVRLLGGSIE
jgi:hypothetical protein